MQPFLIGLAGYSGAGKSTLAQHLEMQGGVKRLRFDHFYKDTEDCPKAQDGTPNWDLPESLHLDRFLVTLQTFKEGDDAWVPVYEKEPCKCVGKQL